MLMHCSVHRNLVQIETHTAQPSPHRPTPRAIANLCSGASASAISAQQQLATQAQTDRACLMQASQTAASTMIEQQMQHHPQQQGQQQPAGAMLHPAQHQQLQHTPVTSPFASPVLSASSSPFLAPHHPYAAHHFHPHPHAHYVPHQHYAFAPMHPASSTASPFSSPTLSPAMTAITSASMSTIPMATLKLDQHTDDGTAPTTAARPSSRAAPKLGAAASPILAAKRVPSRPAAKRSRKQQQTEEDDARMSDHGSAQSGMENDDLDSAAAASGPASTAASATHRRGTSATKEDPSDLVLSSKRRPAPRILSPEAEYEDASDEETLRSENDGAHEDDDDDEEVELNDEDDDDEEEFEERSSSAHKRKSPRSRGANAGATKPKSTKSASGAPPVRCRRGRGRALLGLNVVVTVGRYKGEVGFVTKGANGYYSVQFHRPMPELRNLENTAMKRSSELAPITNTGRRLVLPLSPEQRKQCKMEAAAGLGAAAAAVAARSVRNEAAAAASAVVAPTPSHPSPSFTAATNAPSTAATTHKRKAVSASTPTRRTSANRRGDAEGATAATPVLATAIVVASKQPKQQLPSSQAHTPQFQAQHQPPSSRVRRASDAAASAAFSDSDSHSSDCSSCCSRSSSSVSSPSLAQASETDEAYFSDDSRGPRGNRGAGAGGATGTGVRRKWRSRVGVGMTAAPGSGSGRGRGSSSCSEASTSSLVDSPAVTELYTTPRSLTSASPSVRGTGHYALQMSLPSITLPPAHAHGGDAQHPLSHGGQQLSTTTSLGLLRAQSPRVKKAACILLALSSEGLVESPQDDASMQLPLPALPSMKTHDSTGGEHVTYELTHIASH